MTVANCDGLSTIPCLLTFADARNSFDSLRIDCIGLLFPGGSYHGQPEAKHRIWRLRPYGAAVDGTNRAHAGLGVPRRRYQR